MVGFNFCYKSHEILIVFLKERQQAEHVEKELKQKTEALDYLNSELEKIETTAKDASERKLTLHTRLDQMLQGILEIFKLVRKLRIQVF